MLALASAAPDLPIKTHLGFEGQLSTLWQEGPLILFFYPKDNTPTCTKEACTLQTSLAEYGQVGANVVGANLDSLKSHANFARKQGLTFPLIADEGGKLAKAYDALRNLVVLKLPKRITYVIDRSGHIRGRNHDEFNVDTHLDMIRQTLNKLSSETTSPGSQ